jgi:prepilin-type N-terminal cleavage/methylation domain-containing protein
MKKGFTLVELLVVIAIISILTIITVSQFQTAKRKGNDVQRKADLNNVSKSLLMYFADYGKFPAATADGELTNGNGVTVNWTEEFRDKDGYTYMKVLPQENYKPDSPYCYKTSPDLKKFALFAQLENTVDKDCEGHAYSCGGVSTYCYGIVSPNTNLDEATTW